MKKLITFLLAVAMLLMLAACSLEKPVDHIGQTTVGTEET